MNLPAIFIALKNDRSDHEERRRPLCTWSSPGFLCASFGPVHMCGQTSVAVNDVSSRKRFACCLVLETKTSLSDLGCFSQREDSASRHSAVAASFWLDSTLQPPRPRTHIHSHTLLALKRGWPQHRLAHLYGWISDLEPHGPISAVAQ